jgi:hypothetical protein
MNTKQHCRRRLCAAGGLVTLLIAVLLLLSVASRDSKASIFTFWRGHRCGEGHGSACPACGVGDIELSGEAGGTWYWLHSPEDEKRVIISLYNRYCIRCHGVDGRGVWDIPDVPDFTSASWQSCRSDGQLTRAILEGRGACMPPFRGTLTLEEACAMARYLRTFLPGTEESRPEVTDSKPATETLPAPKGIEPPKK